jgi:hypothetical protein
MQSDRQRLFRLTGFGLQVSQRESGPLTPPLCGEGNSLPRVSRPRPHSPLPTPPVISLARFLSLRYGSPSVEAGRGCALRRLLARSAGHEGSRRRESRETGEGFP